MVSLVVASRRHIFRVECGLCFSHAQINFTGLTSFADDVPNRPMSMCRQFKAALHKRLVGHFEIGATGAETVSSQPLSRL